MTLSCGACLRFWRQTDSAGPLGDVRFAALKRTSALDEIARAIQIRAKANRLFSIALRRMLAHVPGWLTGALIQ
jgi:hypothetical protein